MRDNLHETFRHMTVFLQKEKVKLLIISFFHMNFFNVEITTISARTYVVLLGPVGFFEESKRLLFFVLGINGENENGCWEPWNRDRHQL